MLALRTGLDGSETLLDREIDGLVIADLEMQEGMVLDAAPVATVKPVRAHEVDRAGNAASIALGHDQQDVIGHAFADQREEVAVEVGLAPFTAARVEIEGVENRPTRLQSGRCPSAIPTEMPFSRASRRSRFSALRLREASVPRKSS